MKKKVISPAMMTLLALQTTMAINSAPPPINRALINDLKNKYKGNKDEVDHLDVIRMAQDFEEHNLEVLNWIVRDWLPDDRIEKAKDLLR